MLALLSLTLLGFVLGMRHALDPDHVVAITTIVSRCRSMRSALWVGARWGIGHTITILLVGTAIIVFKLVIPPRLGLAMELAVGIMLVVLGVANLARPAAVDPNTTVRPLLVGLVHGLAGSAAVALLVLTAVGDPRWGAAYLLLFGAGTVAGMMLVTGGLALPAMYAARRMAAATRHLRVATGILSVAFGLFLIHEIGFVDGLFTAHPAWTPR